MNYTFYLKDVDCANCAGKIEQALGQQPFIKKVNIDFFTTKVQLETTEEIPETSLLEKLNKIADKVEAGAIISAEKGDEKKESSCSDGSCSIDHDHDHDHHDTHNHGHSDTALIRIIVSSILFVAGIFITNPTLKTVVLISSYLIVGYDILIRAAKNLLNKQVFDEHFLMSLASIGAILIGEVTEAVAVMLFFQIGEYFEHKAVDKSRKSIAALMDIRPDTANLKVDNQIVSVDPKEVNLGDIIIIRPGEKVPLDGTVVEGISELDMAALTGESLPREVNIGDEVLSGSINRSGLLEISVTKSFGDSTVSKILELVENASSSKAESENFITKFARYYTPIVVLIALVIAFIVPIIVTGNFISYDYIKRALVFLVISCPCALVISVPLSFFGGIGGASKLGILLKGSNYIELLANAKAVVFDKTGTLTKGSFSVDEIIVNKSDEKTILEIAAYGEYHSTHPIAQSIVNKYDQEFDLSKLDDVTELAHYGVVGNYQGKRFVVGNHKLMQQEGIDFEVINSYQTIVYVAYNKEYLGAILISDTIKEDALETIEELHKLGVKRTVLLTGDNDQIGQAVATSLKIKEVHTELYPADKVEHVESIEQKPVIFVGDGINDAPVLTVADVGIAMGGVGSDAAIEAADVIIMDDKPSKIATAISISRRTMRIVKENIIFALGVKFIILILGALGYANMWLAVFADVGVSLLAILNAMRVLNVSRYKTS